MTSYTAPGRQIIRLRDGRSVYVRQVEATDEPAITEFLEGLSLEARRLRFFTAVSNLTAQARWAASADGRDHCGLVAFDSGERLIGHGAYVRMYGRRAEVAVEVADDVHHHGLGTLLIVRLARLAETNAIDEFVAEVLPENREMLDVFRDGFNPAQHREDGVIEIVFPTSRWRQAARRFGIRMLQPRQPHPAFARLDRSAR